MMACSRFTLLDKNDFNVINNKVFTSCEYSSFSFECNEFYVVSQSNGIFEANHSIPTNQPQLREYLVKDEKIKEGLHYRGISFGDTNQITNSARDNEENKAYIQYEKIEDPFEHTEFLFKDNEGERNRESQKHTVKTSPKRIRVNINSTISEIEKLSNEVRDIEEQVNYIKPNDDLKEAVKLLSESCVIISITLELP